MTTPRTRSLVSLAAALIAALMLGGCASAPSRPAPDELASNDGPLLAISFDNQAHDYVHVYLVSVRGQWLLGRVEAGARTTLQIPDAALAQSSGVMWLAVLTGRSMRGRVADDPQAVTTIAEPVTRILLQRWTFSPTPANGLLSSFPRPLAEIPRQQ